MNETSCAASRADLSAFLDGELDDPAARRVERHLASCRICRAELELVAAARRAIRVQPIEEMPDLVPSIMSAATPRAARPRSFASWSEGFKVAAVAAAIGALIVAGATLPRDHAVDVASATEISAGVSSAARSLTTYRASYDVVERGWDPDVGTRRFSARISFHAPEDLRLVVSDHTRYPSAAWPRNDVTLVANPRRWWIREPSECPQAALPACAARWGPPIENRTIVARQPFDGATNLPTDLVVPLETVAGSDSFRVAGSTHVAGRNAYRLDLSYREAAPLVDAIESGGSWRPFNPLDKVELWIDDETWFPLAFRVTAAPSHDRRLWADQQGLRDDPGETLLHVRAVAFSTPRSFDHATFEVPTRGIVKSGGFASGPPPAWAPTPRFLAGLHPYRSGLTSAHQAVASYARGMTWLKMTATKEHRRAASYPTTARQVHLEGGSGWAYYEPATSTSSRRLDVISNHLRVHIESNLASHDIAGFASSLDVRGRRAPKRIVEGGGSSVTRITTHDPYATTPYALAPSSLPHGYSLTTSLLARSRDGRSTLTTYYDARESEYGGSGIQIAQSRPVHLLPPSSHDYARVSIGRLDGRWSSETGSLEWIDSGTYRSVSAPGFDLGTVLAIARSMS